ncbi:hypothetical protein QUF72_21825 [Desulfobacterales bacterium HSG2]|nr:hypothetical protein [Desulfobacterales bacterium HSG2]
MRLKDIERDDEYLEMLVVWGIDPMKELVEIMAEEIEELDTESLSTKRLTFIHYELLHKLEDMEEAINRFDSKPKKKKGKKVMAKIAKESVFEDLKALKNADFEGFKKGAIPILKDIFETLFEHDEQIQAMKKEKGSKKS